MFLFIKKRKYGSFIMKGWDHHYATNKLRHLKIWQLTRAHFKWRYLWWLFYILFHHISVVSAQVNKIFVFIELLLEAQLFFSSKFFTFSFIHWSALTFWLNCRGPEGTLVELTIRSGPEIKNIALTQVHFSLSLSPSRIHLI